MRAATWFLPLWSIACQDSGCADPAKGSLTEGEACVRSEECDSFYVCAGDATCQLYGAVGTAIIGDPCPSSEYCLLELACNHEGLCAAEGSPSTADLGAPCDADDDCQASFHCAEQRCGGIAVPAWEGADCEVRNSDTGPLRVYFEIPRGAPLSEFFRLPFPSDVRVSDGALDLQGYPNPGPRTALAGDALTPWLTALSWEFTGFGAQQGAVFQTSGEFDLGDLSVGAPGHGTTGIVDITPGATFGRNLPSGMRAETARNTALCYNWISVFPTPGHPLEAGHTYAAYVTTRVTTRDNLTALSADADFRALLLATPPTDSALTRAWEQHAPLRDWLSAAEISPDLLAGAALFTVQQPLAAGRMVYSSAQDLPAPEASALHRCGADPGPFATDDPTRGCQGEDPNWIELQGAFSFAQFQVGQPPYKRPEHGGWIEFAGGQASPERWEEVVFSLFLPRETPPPEGWPLVMVAPDSWENYRAGATIAEDLLGDVDGSTPSFAVLTLDPAAQGPRAAPHTWEAAWLAADPLAYHPARLAFNPYNPWSARDGALQGMAELALAAQWARAAALSVSGVDGAVAFQPEIYLFAQGAGADAALALAANDDDIGAVVLLNPPGFLTENLIHSAWPVPLKDDLGVLLANGELSRHHPSIGVMQAVLERRDGANALKSSLERGVSVLHIWSTEDLAAPYEAQLALARAGSLAAVLNGQPAPEGLTAVTPPVAMNRSGATAVVSLYAGTVEQARESEDVRRQWREFLRSAQTGVPTVVP